MHRLHLYQLYTEYGSCFFGAGTLLRLDLIVHPDIAVPWIPGERRTRCLHAIGVNPHTLNEKLQQP